MTRSRARGVRSPRAQQHPFSRSRPARFALLAGLLGGALTASACTDDPPEPTTAELLSELEGRELTAAEIAQREQVAQTLCRLDDQILIEVWGQLSTTQLEFQDFVFSRECEGRLPLYAEATGRFAVEGN